MVCPFEHILALDSYFEFSRQKQFYLFCLVYWFEIVPDWSTLDLFCVLFWFIIEIFFLLFKCCYFFLIFNFGLMVYMDSGLSLCPKFLLIEFRIDEWLKSSRFSIEHTKSVFLLSFSIPAGLWIFSCSCLFGCSKMLRIEESGQMRIRCRKRNNNRKLRRGVSSGTTGTSLVEKGTKHKFAD